MDDANCFHMIRLELKTTVNDMNVTVVSTVTGCDVTTVQQNYKGSTSRFAVQRSNSATSNNYDDHHTSGKGKIVRK